MTRAKIKAGRNIAATIANDRLLRNRSSGGLEMADRLLRRILRLLQNRQSRARNAEERRLLRYAIAHWRAIIGKHDIGGDLQSDISSCKLLLPIMKSFDAVAKRRHTIVSTLDNMGAYPRREIHLAARVCRDYAMATTGIINALSKIISSCEEELKHRAEEAQKGNKQ